MYHKKLKIAAIAPLLFSLPVSADETDAPKAERTKDWAKPKDQYRDEYGIFAPIDANMVARRFPATTDFPTGPKIGEQLPECRLPNQHGKVIDLHASLDGKQGVVVFYRSTVW